MAGDLALAVCFAIAPAAAVDKSGDKELPAR